MSELPKELKNIAEGIQTSKEKQTSKMIPNVIYNQDGGIKKLVHNLKSFMQVDPKFKEIGFNEFTQEVTNRGQPIDDYFIDDARLWGEIRTIHSFSKADTFTALASIARKRSYHPIKRMIERQSWDGVQRAETLFIDYIGAEDNAYTRAVAKKWLTGAVKRIYESGCKFEIVPILQGKQGIGKSTLASKLGGEYFIDSLKGLGNNKDDYQLLIGTWICELGELASLNSTETETVKNFISASYDKIRLPYDKITSRYERTVAFIGTANPKQYLKDYTGNRRFYPIPSVQTPNKNVFEMDDATVQQIWAEALTFYKDGVQPFFDKTNPADLEIIQLAEAYQSEAVSLSGSMMAVEEYLSMPVPQTWGTKKNWEKRSYFENYQGNATLQYADTQAIDRVTVGEILDVVLRVEHGSHNNSSMTKQVKLFMDNQKEWEYKASIKFPNGKVTSGYQKKIR